MRRSCPSIFNRFFLFCFGGREGRRAGSLDYCHVAGRTDGSRNGAQASPVQWGRGLPAPRLCAHRCAALRGEHPMPPPTALLSL